MFKKSMVLGLITMTCLLFSAIFIIIPAQANSFIYGDSTNDASHYCRVVKLGNGDLLTTFMREDPIPLGFTGSLSYYFYRSTNNGDTWSYLSELDPDDDGIDTDLQGYETMFVFPQTLGNYSAGTVLVAVTCWENNENTIQIWRSTNSGASWTKHSSLAPASGTSGNIRTWEPEFAVSSSGDLVCYYADERWDGYNQCISQQISTDGGINWGTRTTIVGENDDTWRPGMPRVTKLKDGNYLMVYENNGSTPASSVRCRLSSDGVNWGTATDRGTLVGNIDDSYAIACPELGYIDDGSDEGRIFVRGMLDNCSPSKLFTSTDSGEHWTVVDAPLNVVGNLDTKAGYSGTLLGLNSTDLLEINAVNNGSYNEITSNVLDYSSVVVDKTILFWDGFENNNFTFKGWTNNGCDIQSTYKYANTYALRLNNSEWVYKRKSTVGYTGIRVEYVRKTQDCEIDDYFCVDWYNGSSWVNLETVTGSSDWTKRTYNLPSSANDNPNFYLRFITSHNGVSDYAYVDELFITGTDSGSGQYYKIISKCSGQALSVGAGSLEPGTVVVQWPYNGSDYQLWKIEEMSDGYSRITSKVSGCCLDVDGGSTEPGAGIIQWLDNGLYPQRWLIQDMGSGYYQLTARCSGCCLDVPGGSLVQGIQMIQWTDNDLDPQRWQIVRVQ